MNFYTNKTDIKKWLSKYKVKNYTINDDLTVNVNGNVDLSCNDLTYFPVQFNHVSGYFDCSSCPQLTSLVGCPSEVGGSFDCSYCAKLTSLKGLPLNIAGTLCIDTKNKDDHYLQYCTFSNVRCRGFLLRII